MNKVDSILLEKTLPQSIEAEKAVISSMLIDNNAIIKIADQISIDDFYLEAHKVIVKSILELYEKGEPVDWNPNLGRKNCRSCKHYNYVFGSERK